MIYDSELLTAEQVSKINHHFDSAPFKDGIVQSDNKNAVNKEAKDNYVMAQTSSQYRKCIDIVQTAFHGVADFSSCYVLKEMTVPIFTEYREGGFYKPHVDDLTIGGIKTHHSMTLFLNEPDEYEGGELVLVVGDTEYFFKPPAGTILIYPTGLKHHINPVISGKRRVALMWAASAVEDTFMRYQLIDLSKAVINASKTYPGTDDESKLAVLPFEQIRVNFLREYGNI